MRHASPLRRSQHAGGGGIGRNTIGVPRAQQSNELWHRPNYAEQGADDAEECHAIHG